MALRETEKGYYVEVFLGKDPITGKKIRKTKLFPPLGNRQALKDAKAFEAEWLKMSANGEIDINGKMLLSEYLDHWYETYVVVKCAISTQERYLTFIKCIKKGIGHIKLEKLSPPVVQKFYSNLLVETKTLKDGTIKRRYANGTVLKLHKMLHLALKCAVLWQMIHVNPADNVIPPPDDIRDIKVWTIEEAILFFDLIQDTSLYPAAYLAFATGIREGEISALKWEDVDFTNKIIKVKNNTTEARKQTFEGNTKTFHSKRDVSIDDETATWLKRIKLTQQAINLALTEEEKVNYQYVCSWLDGRPYRPKYISKQFTSYVKKYSDKLTKITFHGLRHTHASILFEADVSSNVISRRLGHARTSITDDIYIHIKPERHEEAATKFANAIKPKLPNILNKEVK